MPIEHYDPQRVVILENPVSTRAAEMAVRLHGVHHEYGKSIVTLPTTGETERDETALAELLEPGDVLCIAGGDGTVNLAVNVLAEEEQSAKRIPILPVWGGNGNDLARTLNGSRGRRKVEQIIREGEVQ